MSFPTYPAYKDSGVKWLSDIPEHWQVRRNKQVFRLISVQVGKKSADFQLLSLTLRGVIPRDMESGKGKFPAEFNTYQVVEPGDIVFCLFDIDETPRTVGISSDFGMITGAYTVAKTLPAADPRFIYYYYFSIDLRKGLRPFYTGLRKVVRPETFLNIELPLPPLSEQANICNFLDYETARIDALIEEQQRLIELLKEKRQAVISHAVTKGLDPTVPMKDSGVEWLGEVPAHWVVSKLKFMTDRVVDCPHETPNYNPDGDYLVIRTADLDQGLLKPEQMYRLDRDEYVHRTRRASLKKNDVVYGREGERWGHAALVPESDLYALGQRMMQIRVSPHICPEYFMFQLNSVAVYRQGEVDTVGATSPHVNISTIINYQMMVPPKEEQSRISMYLNKILLELHSLIRESGDAMGLLQERRSALISAAVTGKIDVRNWQPPAGQYPAGDTQNRTEPEVV